METEAEDKVEVGGAVVEGMAEVRDEAQAVEAVVDGVVAACRIPRTQPCNPATKQ